MNRLIVLGALGLAAMAAAYADSYPVQGMINGSFDTPSSGNGSVATTTTTNDTWQFVSGVNSTKVVYVAGPNFGLTNIPPDLDISLGSLTLSVAGQGGIGSNGTYTDNLNINVAFTTPTGGLASFADTLSLQVVNGTNGYRVLFSGLPSPVSFMDASNVLYTVTFDGMFDAATGGTDITADGLQVDNGGNSDTAYLRATISAAGPTVVPEPGSISLLLSAIGGVAIAMYRKRSV
jgi:hypothetical protein